MKTSQKIYYADDTSFYLGIQQLVSLGLTFEALHDDLVIYLTGGC